MRVMSFNVRLDTPADGPDAWPHRRDWVAEIVRENADLVGFQEVLGNQRDDLKVRLPEFALFGPGREDGRERGEAVPLAYRVDRFDRLDGGAFWLSETPDVPGSMSWDGGIPRVTTWLRLRDRESGRAFFALSTHFDYDGPVARRESAKLFRAWISERARTEPVIAFGDYNSTTESEPYRILTEDAGLTDARLAARSVTGPDSSWNGFRAVDPGFRIDYVFVAGDVAVESYRAFDETRDGRFASDHLPIAARVRLGRRDS